VGRVFVGGVVVVVLLAVFLGFLVVVGEVAGGVDGLGVEDDLVVGGGGLVGLLGLAGLVHLGGLAADGLVEGLDGVGGGGAEETHLGVIGRGCASP